MKNLDLLMKNKKKEVKTIETKVDKKILEFKRLTKRKRKEIDLLNIEIEKKKKLLKTLNAANEVYSARIVNEEITVIDEISKPNQNYFYIQISASKNKSSSEKILDDLEKQEFSAELIRSKGLWKVICCGKYPTKEEAINIRSELLKKFPNGQNIKNSIIYDINNKPL